MLLCAIPRYGWIGTDAVSPSARSAVSTDATPTDASPTDASPTDATPTDAGALPGKCGKNLTWTLDGAGTLTVSGKVESSDARAILRVSVKLDPFA